MFLYYDNVMNKEEGYLNLENPFCIINIYLDFILPGTYLIIIQLSFIFKSVVEKTSLSRIFKSTLMTTTPIFHVSLISLISGNEKNSSKSNFSFDIMRFRYSLNVVVIRWNEMRITVFPLDKNMFSVCNNPKTSIHQIKWRNIGIVVLIFIIVQESYW